MLRIVNRIGDLSFLELKRIYLQSNIETAKRDYPQRDDGLLQVELDFYDYLRQVFFKTDGAYYCLWEEQGQIVSALRMEPFQDGLLVSGLETEPSCRGCGYASKLLDAALKKAAPTTVYSHIFRDNPASIAVHQKCGFEKITNFAVFLDGSVSQKADTYCKKFVNN